jgi:OHCU decarboxylase
MLSFIDKLGEQVEAAPRSPTGSDWSDQAFIQRFGGLFDHSPWIVERAAKLGPVDDLHATLMKIVEDAAPDEQIALICAHPELAGKAAIDHELTEASAAEQASAGLDQLTAREFEHFHALNAAYRKNLASRSSSASASPTRQASLQRCIAASTTRAIRKCELRSARSVRSFACAWEKSHDA